MPDNVGSGNCLEFDGTNDFVNIGTTNIPIANSMSIEAWINTNTTGTVRPVVRLQRPSPLAGLG